MASWQWIEIETMWHNPELTAQELHVLIPAHSVQAIRKQRERMGRWSVTGVPLCCNCEERPVWIESPTAKRYGLCKGCYLEEERMRLEDAARHTALRQQQKRHRQH